MIGLVAGEPNSINSEIIIKAWKKIDNKAKIFIIGNYLLIKKQMHEMNLQIPLAQVDRFEDIIEKKKLNIVNIPLDFNSALKINEKNKKKYVLRCLDLAHKLALKKKIKGFINAPIDKKVFNNKYLGVTEYLASKNKVKNREVMMIYNKKLSVVPLTTHLEIKNVTNKIKFSLIKTKILILNKYYFQLFKKKPRIAILGLNPHNSENRTSSIENKIITPAVNRLKKLNINIKGPFPADTAFVDQDKNIYDVIVGMYHDQVLTPFKTLYKYDAINITLGLNYLRVSPDHGIAKDIIGLNKANPQSLISAINFLERIND